MCTYNVLIIFNNGVSKVVTGVQKHGVLSPEFNMFFFEKNDYRGFVPVDNVKYFGREFDWEEE